jgi:hypothetical protein
MLQRHANVDVRFVLAQPDVPAGSHPGGLGASGGLADAAIEAAFSILEARTLCLPRTFSGLVLERIGCVSMRLCYCTVRKVLYSGVAEDPRRKGHLCRMRRAEISIISSGLWWNPEGFMEVGSLMKFT